MKTKLKILNEKKITNRLVPRREQSFESLSSFQDSLNGPTRSTDIRQEYQNFIPTTLPIKKHESESTLTQLNSYKFVTRGNQTKDDPEIKSKEIESPIRRENNYFTNKINKLKLDFMSPRTETNVNESFTNTPLNSSRKKKNVQQLDDMLIKLEKKKKEQRMRLFDQEKIVDDLKEKMMLKQQQKQELEKALQKSRQYNNIMGLQNERLKGQKRSLQIQINKYSQKYIQLTKKYKEQERKYNEERDKQNKVLLHIKQQIQLLKEQGNGISQENKQLKEQNSNLKQNINERQIELVKVREQWNKSTKELQQRYENKLKDLFNELTSFYKEKQVLNSQIQEYKQKIMNKEQQLTQQNHKLSTIQATIKGNSHHRIVKQYMENVQSQILTIANNYVNNVIYEHISKLQTKISTLSTHSQSLSSRVIQLVNEETKKQTNKQSQPQNSHSQLQVFEEQSKEQQDISQDWVSIGSQEYEQGKKETQQSPQQPQDNLKYEEQRILQELYLKNQQLTQMQECIQTYKQIVSQLKEKIESQGTVEDYYCEVLQIFNIEQNGEDNVHEQLITVINEFTRKLQSLVSSVNLTQTKVQQLQKEKQILYEKIGECENIMDKLDLQNRQLHGKCSQFKQLTDYAESLEFLNEQLNQNIIKKETIILKLKYQQQQRLQQQQQQQLQEQQELCSSLQLSLQLDNDGYVIRVLEEQSWTSEWQNEYEIRVIEQDSVCSQEINDYEYYIRVLEEYDEDQYQIRVHEKSYEDISEEEMQEKLSSSQQQQMKEKTNKEKEEEDGVNIQEKKVNLEDYDGNEEHKAKQVDPASDKEQEFEK